MIDRVRYAASYNIPPADLAQKWRNSIPTGEEVETFLYNEVGEETKSPYFVATSDLLLDAVKRQKGKDREKSLAVIYPKLIDGAALIANGDDVELQTHFRSSLDGFAALYREYFDKSDFSLTPTTIYGKLARVGSMVLPALLMSDVPLARMIANPDKELTCPNCPDVELLTCPRCNSTIVPYEFYERGS